MPIKFTVLIEVKNNFHMAVITDPGSSIFMVLCFFYIITHLLQCLEIYLYITPYVNLIVTLNCCRVFPMTLFEVNRFSLWIKLSDQEMA